MCLRRFAKANNSIIIYNFFLSPSGKSFTWDYSCHIYRDLPLSGQPNTIDNHIMQFTKGQNWISCYYTNLSLLTNLSASFSF